MYEVHTSGQLCAKRAAVLSTIVDVASMLRHVDDCFQHNRLQKVLDVVMLQLVKVLSDVFLVDVICIQG